MNFDEGNKVIIDSMDEAEARAFTKFLWIEILRHEKDIEQARELIGKVYMNFPEPSLFKGFNNGL